MKNLITLFCLLVVVVMSGCATSPELIRTASIGTRSDAFQELSGGGAIPPGYADLHLTSFLKTHRPGIYSVKDTHGTSEYRLLLNIDGQVTRIEGTLKEEISDQRGIRDPEAGAGIRYHFSRNLRLKAGTHKIVIVMIEDEIAVERQITLADGSLNSLVLEPVYSTKPGKRRPGAYSTTSFTEGIRSFRLVLNGREI